MAPNSNEEFGDSVSFRVSPARTEVAARAGEAPAVSVACRGGLDVRRAVTPICTEPVLPGSASDRNMTDFGLLRGEGLDWLRGLKRIG